MEEKMNEYLEEAKKMLKKVDKDIQELVDGEEKNKEVYLHRLNSIRESYMCIIERTENIEREIAMNLFHGGIY